MGAFQEWAADQQNDYLGWIIGAKRQQTIEKRLVQMLNELESGERYMKMPYNSKDQKKKRPQWDGVDIRNFRFPLETTRNIIKLARNLKTPCIDKLANIWEIFLRNSRTKGSSCQRM